jgi:dipeptidyl aminopeptidase/acylaminoacyl peptidase
MADPRSIWVGKDEHEGVRSQRRKDLTPPSHWRLDAIAATHRPRSLTIGADRRRAVFIEDRDTSDVWLLDLEAGTVPERLTTGREPAPYWEDTWPYLSPDGSTVAYADSGHVWLAPTAGGPPRKLVEGGSPRWAGDDRLIVTVERDEDRTTRLAILETADPWPRRLAREHPHGIETHGDEGEAVVSPDGTEVAYTFRPRRDLNRSEIRVASIDTGEARALTGTPRMHDREPAWSPDGAAVSYVSERSGFYEIHVVTRDGTTDRQLTHAAADHTDHDWHPDGGRIVAVRGDRNRFHLVVVDAGEGSAETLASGGTWCTPHWTASGDIVAGYEDHATPRELRRVQPGEDARTIHAPAPKAVRRAPYAPLEEVIFPSFDGLEIPGFLLRPRMASRERPIAAVVYPHGGPTSYYGDEWDGEAQYFVDRGYAWLAINFRGSTGYGRDFERANHGVWGVDDTKDCLAAADFLRTLDWIDDDRLAIFGASYGSYMALLSVTDDPEHRFRCAALKYGDCDIETSWAQGDREGVQDLERMMGPPWAARDAYRKGSPYHRLENIEVPLLIAHGERDVRVSPKQSAQLVTQLRRLGKTFEYVTYPTEAHGFLRAGPRVDFYTRLERFLNWNLMSIDEKVLVSSDGATEELA